MEAREIIPFFTEKSVNTKMRPPPVVTGISPAEGPPGTKVIIRGEHLGVNAKDVTGLAFYVVLKLSFVYRRGMIVKPYIEKFQYQVLKYVKLLLSRTFKGSIKLFEIARVQDSNSGLI